MWRLISLATAFGLWVVGGAALAADPGGPQAPTGTAEAPASPSNTIRGELVKIEGRYYVIKDDSGNEVRLLVSQDTDLTNQPKPGDRIEVQTSPVEHAMFIRALAAHSEMPAGPSKIIRGELVKIEGPYYVIRDGEGREVRLHVSKDTELSGSFKPGDQIEAHASPMEHAMSIKAAQ